MKNRLLAVLVAVATVASLPGWLEAPAVAGGSGRPDISALVRDAGPPVATGAVLGAQGKPIANAQVVIEAFPDDVDLAVGDIINMIPATAATTDASGRYNAQLPLDDRLLAVANARSGFVNFAMTVTDGEVETTTYFSRLWTGPEVAQSAWSAAAGAQGRWVDGPDVDVAAAANNPSMLVASDVSLAPNNPLVRPAEPGGPNQCTWAVHGYHYGIGTTIAEVHTPSDTDSSVWNYTQSTSTKLSVMVKLGTAAWSASGNQTVSTSSGSTIGQNTGSDNYSRKMRSDFTYRRDRRICVNTTDYRLQPHAWEGGLVYATASDGNCTSGSWLTYRKNYASNALWGRGTSSTFTSGSAAAITYGGGTASFTVDSTFGSVQSWSLDFGSASTHYLCGSNDYPNADPDRINAGA